MAERFFTFQEIRCPADGFEIDADLTIQTKGDESKIRAVGEIEMKRIEWRSERRFPEFGKDQGNFPGRQRDFAGKNLSQRGATGRPMNGIFREVEPSRTGFFVIGKAGVGNFLRNCVWEDDVNGDLPMRHSSLTLIAGSDSSIIVANERSVGRSRIVGNGNLR
ncbi:MAG: hypothetical protein ABI162_16995 [Luteolibacter sp.]